MRTILRLGYTNILLQEGIDTKDVVALLEGAEMVQKSGKKWTQQNDDSAIEIIVVLDKTISITQEVA